MARPRKYAPRPDQVPQIPALFDPRLRFTIPQAAGLLNQSVAKTWNDIAKKRLAALHDEGRTYIPGSEILRRSALPTS